MTSPDLATMNRQAIAAAKAHMGRTAWGTVALAAGTSVAYAFVLGLAIAGRLPPAAGFLLLAMLTYMAYTPLHEAAHANIHGDNARLAWLNDLCGHVCAQLIMVPYATHRVEHFAHHRFTNHPTRDPDFVISGMGGGLWSFIRATLRFMWTQWTYLFRDYWATAPRRERLTYLAEVTVALGWRAALLALLPLQPWLLLVPAAWLCGAMFTAYWFAYRPHHPYVETARYRNTNSLIMPRWLRPLEWFWLGQNLHAIHHAFPRVPFYRYHALFREIEPVLRAHGGEVLGLFSRESIPR